MAIEKKDESTPSTVLQQTRLLTNGAIGGAICLVWFALLWTILLLFENSTIAQILKYIHLPIIAFFAKFFEMLVKLGLFNKHDIPAGLATIAMAFTLTGFILGILVTLLIRAVRRLKRKPDVIPGQPSNSHP